MIRAIDDHDWPRIVELEAGAYAGHEAAEEPAALRSRADVSPETSFVLCDGDAVGGAGGDIVGYLLALPYPTGRCPDLARPERTRHRSPNLHLHDIVLAPTHRGRGLAKHAVAHLTGVAATAGFAQISLCAVDGKDAFWAARGFRPRPAVAVPPGYGAGAVYMTRIISQRGHGG